MLFWLRRKKLFRVHVFVRLIQVVNNPRYLIHVIKKNLIYKSESETKWLPYYQDEFHLDGAQSLDYIISNNASLARFSDGEIGQLMGAGEFPPNSNWSQKWSIRLQRDIETVLRSNRRSLLIATDPPKAFLAPKGSQQSFPYCWNMLVDTRRNLWKYLNEGQVYGHSHMFIEADCPEFQWDRFLEYISKRDLIICTGNVHLLTNLTIGRTRTFIECGTNNAYERLDDIISNIREVISSNNLNVKDVLVLASLGPTAAIIAHQLTEIQVLDTGHMFKYTLNYNPQWE